MDHAAAQAWLDRVYDNCFVMQFDAQGQCSEFTEHYLQRR